MKKNFKLLSCAVLLVAIVAGSAVLYNNLVKQYSGNNLMDMDSSESSLPTSDKPDNNVSGESGNEIENEPSNETLNAPNNEPSNAPDDEQNEQPDQDHNENVSHYNPAPDFTVLDENGKAVNLSDYKGRPVVINFWATWCYYCKEEMPDFNEAYKKYPEIQFLMINATDGVSETVESAKKFIEQHNYEFDVFFDTEYDAIDTYGVTGYPTTFFVDADGNLVAKGNGMLNLATLEKGIAMILPKGG